MIRSAAEGMNVVKEGVPGLAAVAEIDAGWWPWIAVGYSLFSLGCTVFWIGMLVHCYRHEPDREFWFWTMLIIPPASLVYFFARWLPAGGVSLPKSFKRLGRGREIEQLEIAARQIGNPHQWIQYGDVLREVGRNEPAAEAYQTALQKEPDNLKALWGAALVKGELADYTAARTHLEQALAIDPKYKFGDVSLAYARVLCHLNEDEKAAKHLEQHVKHWRQPEALFLLATLALEQGDAAKARNHLEGLLLDVKGSPKAIARKEARWKNRAAKLLNQLPR